MRGVVWDGTDLVVADDLEVRDPGPGEVQVRLVASGICHSDLNVIDGTRGPAAPVVVGHEGAGVVERLGGGVTGLAPGDAVVIGTLTPCGECPACRRGRFTDCPDGFGMDGDRSPFSWRGKPVHSYANCSSFAGLVTVRAQQLVPVPGLDPATAALIGCAVSTGYGVVRNVAEVEAGQTVVVFGIGGIGVNALQTARMQDAAHVVAVDVDPAREQTARRYGATAFIAVPRSAGVDEVAQLVRSAAPASIDAAIECSGAPVAIDAAVRVVGPGGVTALVGIPPPETAASVNVSDLLRGRRVVGSLNGAINPARDLPAIVELIAQGKLDVASQVTRVWPITEVHDAIAAVRAGRVVRAVLDHTA